MRLWLTIYRLFAGKDLSLVDDAGVMVAARPNLAGVGQTMLCSGHSSHNGLLRPCRCWLSFPPATLLIHLHPHPLITLHCVIQVALKTNQLGVLYWDDSIPVAALLAEDGTIDGQAFLANWRTLPQEAVRKLPLTVGDIDAAKAKLQAVNLFVLAHRPVGVGAVLGWYFLAGTEV